MAAPVTANATVAMEPERMKEMTRKVTKNISAVPKSPNRPRTITHSAENTMKTIRFRVRKRRSSDAAPT